jgi:hypothetical protein
MSEPNRKPRTRTIGHEIAAKSRARAYVAAKPATAAIIAAIPIDSPATPAAIAASARAHNVPIPGVRRAIAQQLRAEVRRAVRGDRARILANLEAAEAEAAEDRDHGARVRANLAQAKLLGLDQFPAIPAAEQREQWREFLGVVDVVVCRHLAGDALDAFREDLRETCGPRFLAGEWGPPPEAG